MSNTDSVDSTKLMDVVFTVSGGVYGMVKDKIDTLYTSGALQGGLPRGAVVTGVAFDVANDAIKLTFAIASGDPREVAKAAVSAVGGAAGTYVGGLAGASAPVPLQAKPVTLLGGMVIGSLAGDTISEWIFDTYIWPKDSSAPGAVNGGGISLGIGLSSTPSSPLVNPASPPPDSATRDSGSYITDGSANDHQVTINAGGTVWDAYQLQKDQPNGFSNWNDFKTAVAASNPGIADLSRIPADTSIYLPQKMSDGSITYHYPGGASINSNSATGEYKMVVPLVDGGVMISTREYKGDVDGPDGTLVAQYEVSHVRSDSSGNETYNYKGLQTGREGPVSTQQLRTTEVLDRNGDGVADGVSQTDYTQQGSTSTKDTKQDFDGDGRWDEQEKSIDANGDGVTDSREQTQWERQDGQEVQTTRFDANNYGRYKPCRAKFRQRHPNWARRTVTGVSGGRKRIGCVFL